MGRVTSEVERLATGWKGIPITVGLLVAIIGGVMGVAHLMRTVEQTMESTIRREIAQHDHSAIAHPDIRDQGRGACIDLREAIKTIKQQLDRMERMTKARKGRRR